MAAEYIKGQRFKEALPLAEEAVKLEPNNALAHVIFGKRLLGKRDTTGRVAELETVRKQAPESARTHWDLLRGYSSAGASAGANYEKEELEKLSSLEFRQEP